MKTLRADWTTTHTSATYDPIEHDLTQVSEFIRYLALEFAKLDLTGAFTLPKGYEGGAVIFQDSKQQFLYELRGGFALYKRLREQYLQLQEQLLIDAMAEQIRIEIDKHIIEQLTAEAKADECAKAIGRK